MAKNLCAAVVMEVVQAPGLPQYLISRSRPAPVLPEGRRVELWPGAIRLELAPQSPVVASGTTPQMAQETLLEAAPGSFPVLAFLFLFCLLSLSQLFLFLTTRFSFAIFSSSLLVLASGSEISWISLKRQLVWARQSRGSVLAFGLPPLRQVLSPTSIFEKPAIPLTRAILRFRSSPFLLPISPSGSVISWAMGTHSVSSSTCLFPLWLWQLGSPILPASGFFRRH